jgi:hypothetical protein
MERHELIKKIEELPPERLDQVGDFVDSIARGEHRLERTTLHRVLSAYAQQHAGTADDLDADLEVATVEYLLQQTSQQ